MWKCGSHVSWLSLTAGMGWAFPRLCEGNPVHSMPEIERWAMTPALDDLGEPLAIAEVARMLGCSVWTVRQRLLPSGLPYFRIGKNGKLTFYRNQVVKWVLNKQIQEGR